MALSLLTLAQPSAQIVPPGFTVENAYPFTTFFLPVKIVFLPGDRALVLEERGTVWTVLPDDTVELFLDISDEVRSGDGDLGLIGGAIDPDFDENRWVYFSYTVDPNGDGVDDDLDQFARITRYQASESNPNVADLSTRQILVGETWPEGFPTPDSHTIGALRFGADKSLLVGAGDGGNWDGVDAGGRDPGAFGPGRTDPSEDIGAFRARTLNSLSGSILRLDKETGSGLPTNPFWDGNPTSDRSRIWAYGMRNPWRFCLRPGTGSSDIGDGDPGVLYVGDSGWLTYEEINIIEQSGGNYGWPCEEGPLPTPDYQAVTSTQAGNENVLCSSPVSEENPVGATLPDLWFHHNNGGLSNPDGWTGRAVLGGVFYTGSSYPVSYAGRYFLGDWFRSWIKTIEVDANNQIVGWSDFLTEGDNPVDMEVDPVTGDLFYVSYAGGEVRRLRYDDPADVGDPGHLDRSTGGVSVRVYPNPARNTVVFSLELPVNESFRVSLHDVQGRQVRVLTGNTGAEGRRDVTWDGRDEDGHALSGVVLYKLETARSTAGGKLVLEPR